MHWTKIAFAMLSVAAIAAAWSCQSRAPEPVAEVEQPVCKQKDPMLADAVATITEGRRIFRFDTFGNEAFWGDTLRLHEAIAGEANGGVGPGLSPNQAIDLGLKIDVEALPMPLQVKLKKGKVNLNDPATTLALLKLDAVVGITGLFESGQLISVGIHCALCHSTVDNSFAPSIGERLDGWPNRDLDVGTIIALAPNLAPIVGLLSIVHPGIDDAAVRAVLRGWGVGKFDAELLLDGKIVGPRGSAATLIPAAFGLAGVNLHTYTGWGSVPYWNAFVANIEMGGLGTFFDPRLNNPAKFPIAAAAGFFNIRDIPDLITPKLAALHLYQLALKAPEPPPSNFDPAAAARGELLFNGQADCARCHVPPLFTEPGWNMHTAAEMGIDAFQALRSPDERYRTTPLGGLFTREKGGFYHDGQFPTLLDVVNHYNTLFGLNLNESQKNDLVQYLKSL